MNVPDLTRARAVAYGCIFLAVETIVAVGLALHSHVAAGAAGSTDFLMIYASGRLADSGMAPSVYDLAVQQVTQQQVFGATPLAGFFPFYYPPIYLLVCAALAPLPYIPAFMVWTVATAALFLTALRRIVRDWWLVAALCSFPPFVLNAEIGLNATLTAGLLGWGLVLLERRPMLAGAMFGLLSYKPHFVVLVPIALLAGRYWRVLAGFVAAVAALVLLSAVAFGFDSWRAFLASLPAAETIYGGGQLGYWAQISLFGAVRLLGGDYGLAVGIHGAATVLAAGVMAYAWWRNGAPAVRAVTLIAAVLIAVPINLTYDLLPAAVAVAFLCRGDTVPPLRRWEKWLMAAFWPIAFAGRGIAERWGIPLLPLVALGLMAIAVARLRLESSATGFPRPARA